MRDILLRFLINAVAIVIITSGLLPGIRIEGEQIPTIALVAVLMAIVNALIKPIITLLTCPLVLLTFGLFLFVINGLMLLITAALSEWTLAITNGRLVVENFGWALVGALIVSFVGMVLDRVLGVGTRVRRVEKVEVRYVVEKKRPQLDQAFDEFINNRPFDDFDDPRQPPRR